MKRKVIFIIVGILMIGGIVFVIANKTPEINNPEEINNTPIDKCDWSQWGNYFEEGTSWEYCCRLPVDLDGEYGFKEDGSRILNDCRAIEKK